MKVVYARESFPEKVTKSLFLAGPTPRSKDVKSWRPEALEYLESIGYDGTVFVPETPSGDYKNHYDDQIAWEDQAMNKADIIVFWVPRTADMPAFTTNVEFGMWYDSGKAVLGYPKDADRMRYLQTKADDQKIPRFSTLEDTLKHAVSLLGNGASREFGETDVPLLIWRTEQFQKWYSSQKTTGNRLDGAKVLWTFRVGPNKSFVFCYVLHVNVWIKDEDRNKVNEFILSRTDISTIVLFHRQQNVLDSEILLTKEFRSPARNAISMVVEPPGGSVKVTGKSAIEIALEELEEETSFKIDASRIKKVGEAQLAATLSTHTSTLFAGELTDEELKKAIELSDSGVTFGVVEDTEKTYVVVMTIREALKKSVLDWSTIGMIFASVMQ